MTQVLLKRHWRTPKGRFDRSTMGVPTEIPQVLIDRYGLPSDAEIVDKNYKTPEELQAEEALTDYDTGYTAAEQEAEINRRVNAQLDKMAAEAAKAVEEAAEAAKAVEEAEPVEEIVDEDDILDSSVPLIVEQLGGMGTEELTDMLKREKAGKTRSTLVVEIEAALEDRQR